MAKQLKDESEFYEALPLSAVPPVVGPVDRTALSEGANEAWGYVRAGLHDSAEFISAAKRRVWNRQTRLLYLFLVAGSAMAGIVVATLMAVSTMAQYSNDISSPAAILAKNKSGTTILDRNGAVLYQTQGATIGGLVDFEELPKYFVDATLSAEDPDFYDHDGISWRATARAAYTDITTGSIAEGGSTLTQQLIKNALLTPERSIERKFQEVVLATEVERRYTKDEILQMYVSEVPYGQGSYGIEMAAKSYFNKEPKDLTLSESALLAGLPLGPSRFDPNVHPEAAQGRRDYVLIRMHQLGKITAEELAQAKAEPINASSRQITLKAPHFVFYVLNQLRASYGEDQVEKGGLTVTTTLDLPKQDLAQTTVTQKISNLAANNVSNGGLVSLDPKTGDILAMVGSVDYSQPGFGAVNITLSELQPGSSFKPIVYAGAMQKDWNGATILDDKKISLPNGSGGRYEPQNYDLQFRGKVTLRRSLANSLNIPAIEALQYVGIPNSIQLAKDLGVSSLNEPSRYGLSLVLGGAEVSPLDMATVYAGFANQGESVTPRAILKVENRYGKVIQEAGEPTGKKVLDPRVAYMLTDIMSDNKARTEEFGADSPLKLSRPAAAKTGTTNDYRDNWTIGYTPNLVTAVWVGNNDHSPMLGVTGITGAAPIWRDYMEGALATMPVEDFKMPEGLVKLKVNPRGCIAFPGDSSAYEEVFRVENQPTAKCALPKPEPKPEPKAEAKSDDEPKEEKKEDRPRGGGEIEPPEPTPTPKPAPTPAPEPAPAPEPTPAPAPTSTQNTQTKVQTIE